MEAKKTYYPHLDGLRALAICWVVLHHMPVHFPPWFAAVVNRGDLGVEVFFAISGFVVVQSLLSSPGLPQFYLKRIFRIVPAFWVTLAAIWGLSFFDQKLAAKLGSIKNLWASFPLFFYNYVSEETTGTIPGVLNVFWSLCFEEQFYVFLGITALVLRGKFREVLPVLVIGFVVLRNVLCQLGLVADLTALQFQTHLRLDAILVGSLAYLHRDTLKTWVAKVGTWPFFILFLVLALAHREVGVKGQALIYSLMPLVIVGLMGSLEENAKMNAVLSSKVLSLLGVCSYEIYLTHEIVLGGLVRLGLQGQPVLYLCAGLVVSSVIGIFFHRWFSAPLNQALRAKFIKVRASL